MAITQNLDIGLLAPISFTSPQIGFTILTLVRDFLPAYMPERFGNSEPLRHRFSSGDIDQLLLAWQRPFLWKAKRNAALGMVWMNNINRHSWLYIGGKFNLVDPAQASLFLQQTSVQLPADFAYLHMFTEGEIADTAYEMYSPYQQGIVTHDLRKCLPTLCWGMVWGPPYIKLFGRERLLSAPVYIARELGDQAIYTQLTEDVRDLQTQYDMVKDIRKNAMEYLGIDAFYQSDIERGHKYQVPHFHFF